MKMKQIFWITKLLKGSLRAIPTLPNKFITKIYAKN